MIQIISKSEQARGEFNGGQIVENKPIGFPQDGGAVRPYSNLFYWAYAEAKTDSTIQLHPHQGFEIMSFVLKGGIQHYDSKQRQWIPLLAGDAQIIRAGMGIHHAEHMHENSAIFQIWFDPNLEVTMKKPATYNDYTMYSFPKIRADNWTKIVYIGEDSPFRVETPGIEIFSVEIENGSFEMPADADKIYSIYAIAGLGALNGEPFRTDDFMIVQDEKKLTVAANEAKVFVIASPAKIEYKTYQQIMQERISAN